MRDEIDCARAARAIAAGREPSGSAGHHAARCLRCQATRARAARLDRELGALSRAGCPAPPDLVDDVLATLDRADRPRTPAERVRTPGPTELAALAAATAAGALVIGRRKRHAAS